MLDVKTLEGWLWEAACKIRGETDAPKNKNYILSLILRLVRDYGENGVARELVKC